MNILLLVIVLVLVLLLAIFLSPKSFNIPVTGPREGCEDVICRPDCQDYIHDQPLYKQCIQGCFTSKKQQIEDCCFSLCGTLPGSERSECVDACSTPLFQ